MKPRLSDRSYVRSALATLAFYGALLALLFAGGWALGVAWAAAVAGLFLWMYRGALFGLYRWPAKLEVEGLIERERETLSRREPVAEAASGRVGTP